LPLLLLLLLLFLQWYTSGPWTGSTWVGTITMTCSGETSAAIQRLIKHRATNNVQQHRM
jgi:hypothetical protein